MRKLTLKSVLSGVVAVCALMLMTGCDKIMSTLDNPVGSYVKVDTTTVVLSPGETLANRVASTISTETITYKSSNPAVAKVDELSGVVTAVAVGEATITASVVGNEYYMEGKSSYKVKVISIALDKNEALIGVGDYQVLSATIAPADGFGLALNWTSSDEAIAKVDADGKVTAVAPGTAKITAEIGGKTAVCEVTAKAKVDLSELNAPYVAQDGDILTGQTNYYVTIADGATVTLSGVSINSQYYYAPAISCAGDATIVLFDGSANEAISIQGERAGIQIGGAGKTLVIKGGKLGTGKLTAQGGAYAAGIGNGGAQESGYIEIQGGVITAIGRSSAGIGSDDDGGFVGDIMIKGGTITAEGSVGIGAYNGGSCGNITISGGKVTATGDYAGIGTYSYVDNSCGNIAILGGEVTATGGQLLAVGIGASRGSCGDITISDGKVTATSNGLGAGVGTGWARSGNNVTCGKIVISGGEVTANGGGRAAGIGAGYAQYANSICGDIIITNGSVEATGGDFAAAIGTGVVMGDDNQSACGNITISGGTVVATKGRLATYDVGPGTRGTWDIGTVGTVKVTVSVKDADGNDAVIYTPAAAASAARRAAGKNVTLKMIEVKEPVEPKKLK